MSTEGVANHLRDQAHPTTLRTDTVPDLATQEDKMNRFQHLPNVLAGALLLCALGLAGCDQTEPPVALIDEAAVMAKSTTRSVVSIPGLGEHDGESTLLRTRNGVNYRFTTSGLEPGHAYTLWFVAFNAPENCAGDECIPPDLFNAATVPDMMYGGGHVVGGPGEGSSNGRTESGTGQATFSGRVKVGDASGSTQTPINLPSNGLTDPFGAEIHLVLRDHGDVVPEFMPDMIQSLAGGCTDAALPRQGAASPWNAFTSSPDYAHEYGRLGPNTCSSVLLSVHQP